MLTAVFMCQPLGQLAATLVTLIAVANHRNSIPSDSTFGSCDDDCKRSLDSVWRWIIGVGVIPAVIALWFRLTIIESPRYTADVGRDSRKAASELNRYLLMQAQAQVAASASTVDFNSDLPDGHSLRRVSFGAASIPQSEGGPSPLHNRASPYDTHRPDVSPNPDHVDAEYMTRLPSAAMSETGAYPRRVSSAFEQNDIAHGLEEDGAGILEDTEQDIPPPPSWKDFKKYFWHDGNLRTLIATSICWFCVDLPFYGLGMNSPKIISAIWYGKESPPTLIYPFFVQNVWQTLVVVSLGALIGCLVTLVAIDKLGRRNIQMIGFFWLFILFVIIGGSFTHLYNHDGSPAIIVLYILCQIFFNFGPNTTSYLVRIPNLYRHATH